MATQPTGGQGQLWPRELACVWAMRELEGIEGTEGRWPSSRPPKGTSPEGEVVTSFSCLGHPQFLARQLGSCGSPHSEAAPESSFSLGAGHERTEVQEDVAPMAGLGGGEL